MEEWGASSEPPAEMCRRRLESADVVVLVLGATYGSIVADSSGLSYTHVEYRAAKAAGVRVLVFVLDDGRVFEPQAAGFCAEVERETTHSGPLAPRELQTRVLEALARFSAEEGAERLAFQTWKTFFRASLEGQARFSHAMALVGRQGELDELRTAVAQPDGAVVLCGIGGSGKSRLLLEVARWAEALASPLTVRFVAPHDACDSRTVQRLPRRELLLVIDDAHRQQDLVGLVRMVAAHAERPRFLLATRPPGQAVVESAMRSATASTPAVVRVHALDKRTLALDLARAALGPGRKALDKRLVAAVGGSPLLLTVGGRALRDGHVAPELLDRHDAFREAALGDLLRDLPESLDGIRTRDLLRALAGLQPFDLADGSLAAFLGVRRTLVEAALDELRSRGVISGRRHSTRVTPDILADHVFERACVDEHGEATSFLAELLREFPLSLFAILRNAAELDWRREGAGSSVATVSERIWDAISRSAESGELGRVAGIVNSVTEAAQYTPELAWRFAQGPLGRLHTAIAAGHESSPLRDALGRFLSLLGQVPELAGPVTRELWGIAGSDTRATNAHPYHALRVLEDLAGYRAYHRLDAQAATVTALAALAHEGAHVRHLHSIGALLGKALEREGEGREWDGKSMTLSAFGVPAARTRELREQALAAVRGLAYSEEPRDAVAAVDVIARLLGMGPGRYGRVPSNEERESWADETRAAVELLAAIRADAPLDLARWRADRCLRRERPRPLPGAAEALRRANEGCGSVPTQWLLLDLIEDPWHDATDEEESRLPALAAALWHEDQEPTAVVARIEQAWLALRAARVREPLSPLPVMGAVASAAPGKLLNLAAAVIHSETAEIRDTLASILAVIRGAQDQGLFEAVAKLALSSATPEPRRALAQYPRFHFPAECADQRDLEWTRRALSDPDQYVRSNGLTSLLHLGERCPREAVVLFCGTALPDDDALADGAFMVFGKDGIPFDALSHADITVILDKLLIVKTLQHWAMEFLNKASERYPADVISLLTRRIVTRRALDEHRELAHNGYEPVPHELRRTNLCLPPDHPETLPALMRVRDLWRTSAGLAHPYFAELFRMACPSATLAFAAIDDWVTSGRADLVIDGAEFLGEAIGAQALLEDAAGVARALAQAKNVSPECLTSVAQRLGGQPIGAVGYWMGDDNGGVAPLATRCRELLPRFEHDSDMQNYLRATAERAQRSHVWMHSSPVTDEEEDA